MIAPRIKTVALAALSVAAIGVLSGCDVNENEDVANGRLLFTANCGRCHTLKEASTTGKLGPDLDAAFAAARNSGMDQDTIEGIVKAQIADPRAVDENDPSYMPPGILEGQDAKDVATYVASVAGVPGIAPPATVGGKGGGIFINNGCGSCHTLAAAETVGTQGPNLDEVLPGMSEAQIHESIVAPSAKIEQGYPDIMPQTFEDSIEPADLKTLIKFLMDNAGKTGAAGASK